MKSIAIVICLTAILGTLGFIGTAAVAQQVMKTERPAAGDIQASRAYESEAIKNLSKRQNMAFIGAAVGAVLGLGLGLRIASKKDAQTETPDTSAA